MTVLSDSGLATELFLANRVGDEEAVAVCENEVAARIGLDLDETEQGLTPRANEEIDHFMRKNMGVPIKDRERKKIETGDDAAAELYEQVQDLKQLLYRWTRTSKLNKADMRKLRSETRAAFHRSSTRVMVELAESQREKESS